MTKRGTANGMMEFAGMEFARGVVPAAALLLALFGCNTADRGQPIAHWQAELDQSDAGRVMVVAHRGCWSWAPENSVLSMDACVDLGVEAVEIDVRQTRDRRLVVIHDASIDRTSTGSGRVNELTLDEIRAHTLYERDGGPDQRFKRPLATQERVPTLEEVFEACRGKLLINLEIKAGSQAEFDEMFARCVVLAREMNMVDHVFWKIPAPRRGGSDADTPADQRLRTLDLSGLPYIAPILWQADRPFEQQLADLAPYEPRIIEVVTRDLAFWPRMSDGRVLGSDRYRYMFIAVAPHWSGGLSDDVALADPHAHWGRAIDLGADLIMTDRPEQLIRYLKSTGRR